VNAPLCAGLAAGLMIAFGAALAQDDAEALRLADQAAIDATPASPWRSFIEPALRESRLRDGSLVRGGRLSLDTRYENTFAPGWRAALADRLDATWTDDSSRGGHVNTLKEAYVTWLARPDRIADAGRINARYGVALGYNPTDYFKSGAVRSIVSVDPASLRENRMGTVMARAQAVWEEGSLTGVYAPKLVSQPSSSALSPDLGATNGSSRWLVAGSRAIGGARPQWLLFGEQGASPQLGVNATALLGEATVAYIEWSRGRSPTLRSRALGLPDDSAFHQRSAAGLTYTTAFKLSMTAEYHYNGTGLDRSQWNALASASPGNYVRYRNFAAAVQEPPTRDNLFFYASWQDAVLIHLDFSAFQRRDMEDYSRLTWIEARYRLPRADLALQWQRNDGSAFSNFGAAAEQRAVQVLARVYF
jgi:hypothetical protein